MKSLKQMSDNEDAMSIICGGILTPLINVISGIPVIGSQLATICGGIASSLGCIA